MVRTCTCSPKRYLSWGFPHQVFDQAFGSLEIYSIRNTKWSGSRCCTIIPLDNQLDSQRWFLGQSSVGRPGKARSAGDSFGFECPIKTLRMVVASSRIWLKMWMTLPGIRWTIKKNTLLETTSLLWFNLPHFMVIKNSDDGICHLPKTKEPFHHGQQPWTKFGPGRFATNFTSES